MGSATGRIRPGKSQVAKNGSTTEKQGLEQIRLNNYAPVFCSLMTTGTKRDQVCQVIGLQIVIVLVRDIPKLAKWFDVMNVQSASISFLGLSAVLTAITITLACCTLLCGPIRAVVILIPSLPIGVIYAPFVRGYPSRITLSTTKPMLGLFLGNPKIASALTTHNAYRWVSTAPRCVFGLPKCVTLPRAKRTFRKPWSDLVHFSALTARNTNSRNATTKTRSLGSQGPKTNPATGKKSTLGHAGLVSYETHTANRAINRCMSKCETAVWSAKYTFLTNLTWVALNILSAVGTRIQLSWHKNTPIGSLATCLGNAKANWGMNSIPQPSVIQRPLSISIIAHSSYCSNRLAHQEAINGCYD